MNNQSDSQKQTTANTQAGSVKPNITNPLIEYAKGKMSIQDILAPKDMEVDFNYVKIGEVYLRTLFVGGYPRFVTPGWLEPVINFNHSMDIAFYIKNKVKYKDLASYGRPISLIKYYFRKKII